MLTTTIVTPLVVIEPVSGAPVVPASNTIVVEALISSADYIALDTPSEGMLVTISTPFGSTILKFGRCNPFFPHFSHWYFPSLLVLFFCVCRFYSYEKLSYSFYFSFSSFVSSFFPSSLYIYQLHQ